MVLAALYYERHKVDEVEMMNRARKAINDVSTLTAIAGMGLSILRFGYEAGLRRGWEAEKEACDAGIPMAESFDYGGHKNTPDDVNNG